MTMCLEDEEQLSPAAREFRALSEGLRLQFLAELLGVSKQMICRYRTEGAPEARLERLRAFLRDRADRADREVV